MHCMPGSPYGLIREKPIFDVDYSDFFHMADNFEFYYDD